MMMISQWIAGEGYRWILAAHIISILFWMAGLFYLPRLYVYHTQWLMEHAMDATHDLFVVMETRLVRIIMQPAFLASWIFGLLLLLRDGFFTNAGWWLHWKLALVIGLSVYHIWMTQLRLPLARGEARISARALRLLNEIGPLTSIAIVLLAIVKFL